MNMLPHKYTDPQSLKDCLQCRGSGKLFFRTGQYIDCDVCKGSGYAERSDLWEILGLIIKAWRIEKELGLREAARRFKIDPSNLSKMERGIIKPSPQYVKMCLNDKDKIGKL